MLDAVAVCLRAGVFGITVHPRADRRHITPDDVRNIKRLLDGQSRRVEFNIEGDPRPDLIDLVVAVKPDQCTLVPVAPGEITSQAGWREGPSSSGIRSIVGQLKSSGIRVSMFVDRALSVRFAAATGADRIELYTEPFARAFDRGRDGGSLPCPTPRLPGWPDLGMGVNAGHDLDLDNLMLFRDLPFLVEVSIGHAIISRAVFVGLEVVREYLEVLPGARWTDFADCYDRSPLKSNPSPSRLRASCSAIAGWIIGTRQAASSPSAARDQGRAPVPAQEPVRQRRSSTKPK